MKLAKTTECGRRAILDLAAPGDLLCGSVPCAFAPYCCSAVAVEHETTVVRIARRTMLEILERRPAIARALVSEMSCRGISACRRVEELSNGRVEQRIARLLLRLAERSGIDRRGEGTWVPLPITRQDLADLCATTLETAIRVMRSFELRALLRPSARGFLVADRSGLERVAGGAQRD